MRRSLVLLEKEADDDFMDFVVAIHGLSLQDLFHMGTEVTIQSTLRLYREC